MVGKKAGRSFFLVSVQISVHNAAQTQTAHKPCIVGVRLCRDFFLDECVDGGALLFAVMYNAVCFVDG